MARGARARLALVESRAFLVAGTTTHLCCLEAKLSRLFEKCASCPVHPLATPKLPCRFHSGSRPPGSGPSQKCLVVNERRLTLWRNVLSFRFLWTRLQQKSELLEASKNCVVSSTASVSLS